MKFIPKKKKICFWINSTKYTDFNAVELIEANIEATMLLH